MKYGIGLDWDGELNDSDRPSLMPKGPLIPCDCERCFCCVKGLTNRISHSETKESKGYCGVQVRNEDKDG